MLVAASEVVGFAKTGGLADVAGALPAALARRGNRVSVVMPLYNTVRQSGVPLERTGIVLKAGDRLWVSSDVAGVNARVWGMVEDV